MKPEIISFRAFPRLIRKCERSTVRLAGKATYDTIYGGASAMVLAKACDRLGVAFVDGVSAREIVADVYSRSTGKASEQYGGFCCPECGQAHVGLERALQCCAEAEPTESCEE